MCLREALPPRTLMHLPVHLPMHFSLSLVISAALGAAAFAGTWLLLRGRKKKSAMEQERERRSAVNAAGRMTDGALLEDDSSKGDPKNAPLLFYRYSVSGVEYSAAQDISGLRDVIQPETCLPGDAVTVKYDPQNPSNSIVVCELWSGLHSELNSGGSRRHPHISWPALNNSRL